MAQFFLLKYLEKCESSYIKNYIIKCHKKTFSFQKCKCATYCCLPSGSREVYRVGLLVPDNEIYLA